MRLPYISSIALALGAQAVLLPPKLSNLELDFWTGSSSPAADSDKATVYLDCKSCPVAVGTKEDGQPARWVHDQQTELLLDFTHSGNNILLNDVPVYPPTAAAIGKPVAGKQVATRHAWTESEPIFGGPVSLSISVQSHSPAEMQVVRTSDPEAGSVERLPVRRITVDVIGVNGKVVRLDSVEVLFRVDTLEIVDVGLSGAVPAADEQCETVVCRFVELVRAKFAAAKDAASSQLHRLKHACKGGHHHNGMADAHRKPNKHHPSKPAGMPKIKGGAAKFGGKFDAAGKFEGFREGHTHGHHAHGHKNCAHRKLRAFMRGVVSFLQTVVLPAITGLAMGMALGAMAMAIGQVVLKACQSLRSGSRGYEAVAVIEEEDDVPEYSDEKLPTYEEAGSQVETRDEKN